MRASRWMGVVLAGMVAAGACGREDTQGQVEGDEEGVVPAGAIPAPTQGGVDNIPVSATPSGAPVPVDSAAAPGTSGALAPDTAAP